MRLLRTLAAAFAALPLMAGLAFGQAGYLSYGQVSNTAPTYATGTNQPESLDTAGNLRVVCSNCGGGGGGGVSQGTATTSAPTYVNGTNNPLSLTLQGALRVIDSADGPVAPGAAAANSHLIAGVFNTSAPVLTNGQQAAAQFDSSGNLKVNISAGGASGGTSSTFGAAFPSLGTAVGMSQGGNMVAITGTAGNLNVNCQVGCPGSTTAGSVTGGAAASQSNLAGGVFNTSLPTLTNTQQAALQFDANARLIVNLGTALPAGSNVIGAVGGTTNAITSTPTITAAAYTAGQCVGGLQTFANAARTSGPGTALIQSAVITDISGQDANIDLVMFNSNPTNSTFTDHATCTINSADLGKIAGVIAVQDCHFLGSSAPGMCQSQQQALPIILGGGNTTAYAVAISRGTPTYTGTSNLAMRLATLQD